MGYTHYWRGNESEIDQQAWPEAIADCDKIIAAKTDALNLEVQDDSDHIDFNGDETRGEDHEQFVIPRSGAVMQSTGFEFCKTASKPYDDVVTACLARLAEAGLQVSSDGTEGEWKQGLDLASSVLSRPLQYPVTE